ncbi:MAG: UxaA family hydrolase [Armatimonadota bacterium]|nr:UxaA family hydrolase [Armatimonadota bacterium]MDR7455396.1 UxaA family hydrolase [Armatimonadota bacterium]MDR7496520.1 UxaA family hydrolase [Armatimonadota bacterium]MDR7511314.1 UxaA family hydrolase [Armatimonadota bacterium]
MRLTGYRRANGSVGVRNHVAVIPLDDLSNTAAEGVASLVTGTLALPHAYGRLQFGEDLDLFFRTMIGTGANPNIAAAVVIGIEPTWTRRLADGIAATGKPVEALSVEGAGDLRTIERAARAAQAMVADASELAREPVEPGELVVSIKCGESDTTLGVAGNPALGRVVDRLVDAGATVIFGETSELTGGEHLIAARCATPEVREAFMRAYAAYVEFIASVGADLLGSQPTEGNIRGGLSTIEEKALGNIQKTGTRPVRSVLAPAERPGGPGLHFMDTSSAAAEMITLAAAAGSVLHFFTTGQGNVIGNPIVPVIKISPNPKTVGTMREHIDIDLTALLAGAIGLDEAADRIMAVFERTVRGRLTAAEILGHREFVLTRLYRSA